LAPAGAHLRPGPGQARHPALAPEPHSSGPGVPRLPGIGGVAGRLLAGCSGVGSEAPSDRVAPSPGSL